MIEHFLQGLYGGDAIVFRSEFKLFARKTTTGGR